MKYFQKFFEFVAGFFLLVVFTAILVFLLMNPDIF